VVVLRFFRVQVSKHVQHVYYHIWVFDWNGVSFRKESFERDKVADLNHFSFGFDSGPIAVWILHILGKLHKALRCYVVKQRDCPFVLRKYSYLSSLLGEAGNRKDANQTLLDAANLVAWILRFTPSFCLGHGLYNAIYVDAFDYWEGERITVWTKPVLLLEVIFLAGESILYLALAIFIDKWSSNPKAVSIWRNFVGIFTCKFLSHRIDANANESAYTEDDDVKDEETRVMEGSANEDLIVLTGLTKIFGTGKVAVNGVSLGIPRGECFGLLGINGKVT
jgi:hypothetical protein